MGKSLIQTTNQTSQTVAANGIVSPGSVLRRYGCHCRLNGNAIELDGCGYYEIDAAISVAPTAAGNVTVAFYENGDQIPGAIAYGAVSTAGNTVTLPIFTTVRQGCNCAGASSITCVLVEGAGTVRNLSIRVVKS